MATNVWLASAPAVAQVNTVTPAVVAIGNDFNVVVHGNTFTFRATAGTVANVTAGLVALINSSTIAEWLEVVAADITTALTITSRTPGVPFTQTSSAAVGSGGGAPTNTTATTTTSTGPSDWSSTANWSLGAVPVSTDAVVIENSTVDILYGLANAAVTLASLTIRASYTGRIGLPVFTGSYAEYRTRYLTIGATLVSIGEGPGPGSGRIRLALGSVQGTVTVWKTAAPNDSPLESFILTGSHASNVVTAYGGSVGIGVEQGQATAVTATATANGDAHIRIGSSSVAPTLTTVNQYGLTSDVEIWSAFTTLTKLGGKTLVQGTGAITTIDARGGLIDHRSTGTITTLGLNNAPATIDFSRNLGGCTATTTTMYKGTGLSDPVKKVTYSNGILLKYCKLSEVNLDLGSNTTLTPS